jgi:tetratricopeptide (TPR) repeat protein
MHRVLADFMRVKSANPTEEIYSALKGIQSVLESLDLDVPRSREVGLALSEHAMHLARHVMRIPESSSPSLLRLRDQLVDCGDPLAEVRSRSGERLPLEAAIMMYRAALRITQRHEDPFKWADIHIHLGMALQQLGDTEEGRARFDEASEAYHAALDVYLPAQIAAKWAAVLNNLGGIWVALARREPESVMWLTKARKAFEDALQVRTLKSAPLHWATTLGNLADVFAMLAERGEQVSENLAKAIAAYQAVLTVRTRARAPRDWAKTQNALGLALNTLGQLEQRPDLFRAALAAFEAALEVFTRARAPYDWALVQNNIGTVLPLIAESEADLAAAKDYCLRAIDILRQALQDRPRELDPLRWGLTQESLGHAYFVLGRKTKDRTALRQAFRAYRAALQVHKPGVDQRRWQALYARLNELKALGIDDEDEPAADDPI